MVTDALPGFSKSGSDALGLIPPFFSTLFHSCYLPLSQVLLVSLSTPLKIFCPRYVFPLLPYSFAYALSIILQPRSYCSPLPYTTHFSCSRCQIALILTYARELSRYLQSTQGSQVSAEFIVIVLTNSWPGCAPVVCVFQSHGALYQSSHFLFHR